MGFVAARAADQRRHARRWLPAVVLLALAGGAALAAAEAARRTDTAFARDLAQGRGSDAVVNANVSGTDQASTHANRVRGEALLDRIDRAPEVVAHGRLGGANVFVFAGDHPDTRLESGSALGLVAYDTDIGNTIARLRIRAGRRADPADADEIVINPTAATLTGWRVGSHADTLREFDTGELDPQSGAPRPGLGRKISPLVVGIVQQPEELLQPKAQREPRIYLTPAFARSHPETVYYLNEWVRLRNGGRDLSTLRATVAQVNRAAPDISMPIAPTDNGLRSVNRANDPLVNGLWILAAVAALVGLFVTAQSIGRSIATGAGDHAQFRALGATRGQRAAAELLTLVTVAAIASGAAVLVAFLASPLAPVGEARDAEPHAGLAFNFALFAIGFAVMTVGIVVVGLAAVWRVARARALPGPATVAPGSDASRTADIAARAGLGVPAVVGTRFALQPGRGASATPVRSALASLTVVVAAVTATVAFGVNLQRWTTTPRLYGWNWDAAVGSNFGTVPRAFEGPLEHFQNVSAASGMTIGELTVDNHEVPAIGVDPAGAVRPSIDEGRLPQNTGEIVLGAKTMRDLHAHIGTEIRGTASARPVTLTVVGRATFPAFGDERFGSSGLGTGALGVTALFPYHDPTSPDGRFNYILLRFNRGTALASQNALRPWLAERGCPDPTCLLTDSRPVEITGYRSAHNLPVVIAIVLSLVLVATVAHVLGSTLRRRAHDLAVMRALGADRSTLAATLRWQAVVIVGTALAIGIPAGVVAARVVWRAFTNQLGISPGTVWPVAYLVAGVGGILVIAIAVAGLAGVRAGRVARGVRLSD